MEIQYGETNFTQLIKRPDLEAIRKRTPELDVLRQRIEASKIHTLQVLRTVTKNEA